MERDIDVAAVAEQAQVASDDPLAVPELPEGWRANAAELRTSDVDGVTAWYVGLPHAERRVHRHVPGLRGEPDLGRRAARAHARRRAPSRSTASSGRVYDNRDSGDDVGNAQYGLTTEAGGSTFVLLGTATPEEFETLATALVPTIDAQR